MAFHQQRQYATAPLSPPDLFRDPDTLARVEREVVAAIKTERGVTIS